jgi:hypothetical protein
MFRIEKRWIMKALILTLLFTMQAHAGVAKLTWSHDRKATDGSTVTLTGFKIYWGINDGPRTNVYVLANPMPIPWKLENGFYWWSKTYDNPAWVPGSTVCFHATALAAELESDPSGTVCRLFPMDPNAPNLIDVVLP